MAEELLVKEPLTKEMIDAGEKLLRRLNDAHFQVSAAYWLYTSEANRWRLTLASPDVNTDGPRKLYAKIWEVLYKKPAKGISIDLQTITLVSLEDPLVRALADANRLVDLSGKRLSQYGLNGIFVEDIYVYFINPSIDPLPGATRTSNPS